MGKVKIPREVTIGDVGCLENLVVAYNTVFLMSSIFIVSIAGTAQELFSDFSRLLSPSMLLLIVGGFIVLIAGMGYIGVGKKSSTLISLYTLLLIFVFVMELSAGLGILSFRREIKSMVSYKMKSAISAYPNDPMTANLVDYAQLELRCCGVYNYRDWDGIFDDDYHTNCRTADITLPSSCCTTMGNSTSLVLNTKGCLPVINYMLHRSSLLLTTTLIAICTIQVLGAYFAFSLATTLKKFKARREMNYQRSVQNEAGVQMDQREKINYF